MRCIVPTFAFVVAIDGMMDRGGMELGVGDKFGRYTVLAVLGQGGMGRVYRARDEQLQRDVALKLVRVDKQRHRGGRLLREARAAAAIEHANAIAIYDVGEIDGTPFITMEIVEGRSLRDEIRGEPAPLATRLAWLASIARALQAAHDRGIVHRDVKPENVMVRRDGVVKVLDFGIARAATADDEDASWSAVPPHEGTQTGGSTAGTWAGTPRYMAPEQLQGDIVDARADQFSWGVLAYELLAGTPPWPGRSESLSYVAMRSASVVDAAPLRRACPPRVVSVVLRTLAIDRVERFGSLGDVAAALEQASMSRRARAMRVGGLALAVAVVAAAVPLLIARPPSSARPFARARLAPPVAPSSFAPGGSGEGEPPHVVLALDASSGVARSGANVTRWQDQSGNGNDAVAGSLAPTYVEHAIHGRPALHFDGGRHLNIADSPSLQLGKSDFLVSVVAQHTRKQSSGVIGGYGMTTSYGILFGKTNRDHPYPGVALVVNYPRPIASTKLGVQTSYDAYVLSSSDDLNDGRPHIFGARRENGVLEVRIDGVVQATLANANDDCSAKGRDAFIGAQPVTRGIVQQLQGDIAAIVIVEGNASTSYAEAIEAELKARYEL
jgi:serine/threonine-protein kinase